MPTNDTTTNPGRIVDIDVGEEMRGSFLEYAYSVIYARALPDARDGLKPVQRRIIYQANEMGLRPDRGHVKSARVVGDVMGRLHPHGESAIYDALVRMAQPFSFRLPFIDGHGNFGSLDDGPAAMRYTECRLAQAAMPMVASIHEDTVDFAPNYDGREQEPVVLPAAIPALLVNGATGIAVGMATNIAPHNLGEVINAARHLLANPDADVDELMRYVPGPDLPTGGKIIGLDGVRDAYLTGRGGFRMRATATIEQVTPRRRGIVITELPYNVGVERVMQRIKDLHLAKKITGIAGMTDLTDGDNGLRLLIEVKSGIDPQALLAELYRQTPLEESFNINAVALVDGAPQTLSLREMLQVFLDHRREVVQRRSAHRRARAAERLHLVEGLLIAILDIDEVIQVIRSSDDAAAARVRLIDIFDLSEAQANYILDMPLRRLTKFSRLELESEQSDLQATIAELDRILADAAARDELIAEELGEIAAEHATPRRTVLMAADASPASPGQLSLEVADEACVVLLDATGLVARVPAGDTAEWAQNTKAPNAALMTAVPTSTRAELAAVTSTGRVLRVPVVDLVALPATAGPPSLVGATPLSEFVALDTDESIVGLVDGSSGFAVGTAAGVVKRLASEASSAKAEWSAISLKDGDSVVAAVSCGDGDELVFITDNAQLLHFPASAVRPQGAKAAGMTGIRLSPGARVIAFAATTGEAMVATTAGSGRGRPSSVKVTPLAAYPAKGRGTGGVRCHRLLKDESAVVLAAVGPHPRACSASGAAVSLPEPDARRDASGTPAPRGLAALAGGTLTG